MSDGDDNDPGYSVRRDVPGIAVTFLAAAPAMASGPPGPGESVLEHDRFQVALMFESVQARTPMMLVIETTDLTRLQDELDYCENNIREIRGTN